MRILVVVLLVVACGSKSLSPAAARIREGEDSELTDCSFLQKVTGAGGDATAAKNNALENAAALGATHVKWIVPCCTTVEANAFKCDVPE